MVKLYHEPRLPVDFRPAWRRADRQIERDVESFWEHHNLLPTQTTTVARLNELCLAGYHEDALVAVSTAVIREIPFLGCKLAMFRCAVSPDAQRNRLATVIQAHSRELLEQWSLDHPEEEVMGMGAVTQTTAFADRGPARAILRSSGLVFVGWTAHGETMRVAWFEHARIPRRPGAPRA